MKCNLAAASRRTRPGGICASVIRCVAVAFLAAAAQPGRAIEPSATLPQLDLEMKPHLSAAGGSYVAVTLILSDLRAKPGETLLHMPLDMAGTPSAHSTAIRATDGRGPLPLIQEDEPPTGRNGNRRWKVTRATAGKVVISYRALPSPLARTPDDRAGLWQESGGLVGAGFLALPSAEGPFHVRLRWDLSGAPAGDRAVCSLGEANIETDTPAQTLADSYFAVGPLKSVPAQGGGKFGLYWLTDPPFDAAALGLRIQALHARMSAFMGDESSTYRIFMRANPHEGNTASAFAQSLILGYGAGEKVDDLESLLAREMMRNRLALEGEHADTAWYSDGAAEYYSLLLSYRAGLLSVSKFIDGLNERAAAYYARTLRNGRGFMYLVLTDAAIHGKSHGEESLDGVVLELHRREVARRPHGIPQWLDLVGRQIGGLQTQRMYRAMADGEIEIPNTTTFAPCLATVRKSVRTFELGFGRVSLDERMVRDLDPRSAAARSGIKDGDKILGVKGLPDAARDESKLLTLTLRRGEESFPVSYLPRGEQVDSYGWIRNSNVPESACRF